MTKNTISFDINENIGPCIPAMATRGYIQMAVHTIFDVKLDAGLTCKAMLVADGHKVDTPPSTKYAFICKDKNCFDICVSSFFGNHLATFRSSPQVHYLNQCTSSTYIHF